LAHPVFYDSGREFRQKNTDTNALSKFLVSGTSNKDWQQQSVFHIAELTTWLPWSAS